MHQQHHNIYTHHKDSTALVLQKLPARHSHITNIPMIFNAPYSPGACPGLAAQVLLFLLPGFHGTESNAEILLSESKRIGFPVLLKASLGGGGKGMRIV